LKKLLKLNYRHFFLVVLIHIYLKNIIKQNTNVYGNNEKKKKLNSIISQLGETSTSIVHCNWW